MSASGRWTVMRGVLLVAALTGALIAATALSRVLFERPARSNVSAAPSPDAGPSAPSEDANIFQVISAEGQVDAFRDGRWLAIQKGDLLTRDDVVRTVPGARAVLRLSAGAEVELREKVELRLDRLSAAGSSVDLRRGKVVARVGAARETLAITARDTRTSTEGPAHFVVQADEHGQVSVAALKGSARFGAGGKTVTVPEGSQTRSRAGAPPEDPEKIPEDVLLQVVWPAEERHADSAAISGQVRPASLVTINGVRTPVTDDGHFTASVPLREGHNRVQVNAEDLAGRTRQTSTTLVRRTTRPPTLAPEPAELWKK